MKAFYGAVLLLSFSSMGTYKSNDVSVCVCLCVCICVLVSEYVSGLVDCIARKKPLNALCLGDVSKGGSLRGASHLCKETEQ